jgi:hypothetical protein
MHLNWLQPRHIRKDLLKSAPTVEKLAAEMDVDAAGLVETVSALQRLRRRGKDADFNRGENSLRPALWRYPHQAEPVPGAVGRAAVLCG